MPLRGRRSNIYPDDMTKRDRRKLQAGLAELRSRGIAIPKDFLPATKLWPVDSRGYFSKLNGIFYNPSDAQMGFIASDAAFSAFYGSRGSGKSSAGSQKAIRKVKDGQNGAIINPDFENLKISTWPEFREWIPWDMVVPAHRYRRNPEWEPHQPFIHAFTNGVRVIIKGVKDPDGARGPNINWLWCDEAQRDKDGLSWQTAVASVRIGEKPQAWATFTPSGKDHWLYKFFIKQEIPEDALELFKLVGGDRPLIEFFHGTIHDNQENLDPLFMANMLAAYPSGWLRQQEIYGEFVEQGGALGDRSWFNDKIIVAIPNEAEIRARVRFWDLAATEKKITGRKINDPDETVGTKWSWDGKYHYIEHQVCGFWAWDDIKKVIYETAVQDGPYTKIVVEQEPGAGGKNQVAELATYIRERLPGHSRVEGKPPEGDKVMRANTWFAEAKMGLIFLIQGEWVMPFLDQLDCFNMCRHDDKIDSASGARHSVAPIKRWANVRFLHL